MRQFPTGFIYRSKWNRRANGIELRILTSASDEQIEQLREADVVYLLTSPMVDEIRELFARPGYLNLQHPRRRPTNTDS